MTINVTLSYKTLAFFLTMKCQWNNMLPQLHLSVSTTSINCVRSTDMPNKNKKSLPDLCSPWLQPVLTMATLCWLAYHNHHWRHYRKFTDAQLISYSTSGNRPRHSLCSNCTGHQFRLTSSLNCPCSLTMSTAVSVQCNCLIQCSQLRLCLPEMVYNQLLSQTMSLQECGPRLANKLAYLLGIDCQTIFVSNLQWFFLRLGGFWKHFYLHTSHDTCSFCNCIKHCNPLLFKSESDMLMILCLLHVL